jgi:hypothetical protein
MAAFARKGASNRVVTVATGWDTGVSARNLVRSALGCADDDVIDSGNRVLDEGVDLRLVPG